MAAKKKSSWEKLANMFSLGGSSEAEVEEADEETAPATEATSADPGEENKPNVDIFGEEAAEQDPENPALEAMFADAPRRDPAEKRKKRVVDDLGWEDDEPLSSRRDSEDQDDRGGEEAEEISLSFRKKREKN